MAWQCVSKRNGGGLTEEGEKITNENLLLFASFTAVLSKNNEQWYKCEGLLSVIKLVSSLKRQIGQKVFFFLCCDEFFFTVSRS